MLLTLHNIARQYLKEHTVVAIQDQVHETKGCVLRLSDVCA